ncbi:MAG: hypothetical protein LBD11_04000 [Candidatus Peribacteria bacterium]|jgi:hypothetical protein|nr:hypothetical protein [Candidatus Peribacteria bacterium]
MIETQRESEEKKKKHHHEQLDLQHYEKQRHLEKTKLEIQELKSLVEAGLIDQTSFEEIVEDKKISKEEFQEVLDKVDVQQLFEKLKEIEKAEDIDAVVPKELRVSKDEYQQALQDPIKRDAVLQKLDQSLDNIHHRITGGVSLHGNMFATYTYLLSQKLIPVQENIIDLKQPLSSDD